MKRLLTIARAFDAEDAETALAWGLRGAVIIYGAGVLGFAWRIFHATAGLGA